MSHIVEEGGSGDLSVHAMAGHLTREYAPFVIVTLNLTF